MGYCSRLCQSLDKCETTFGQRQRPRGRGRDGADDLCGGELPEWCSDVPGCDQYFLQVTPPQQQREQQRQRHNDPSPTTKVKIDGPILHIEDDYDEKVHKKSCASICDDYWYCSRRDPWGEQYCGTIPSSCKNEPRCISLDSNSQSHRDAKKYPDGELGWGEDENDDDVSDEKETTMEPKQNQNQQQERIKEVEYGRWREEEDEDEDDEVGDL